MKDIKIQHRDCTNEHSQDSPGCRAASGRHGKLPLPPSSGISSSAHRGFVYWPWRQAADPVIDNIVMVPRLTIRSDLTNADTVQYSTNLSQPNWGVLTNLTVTQSPYWFVDANAPPSPQRFYRVVAGSLAGRNGVDPGRIVRHGRQSGSRLRGASHAHSNGERVLHGQDAGDVCALATGLSMGNQPRLRIR